MTVRKYEENDLTAMIQIWNEVVEDGIAFPQKELLSPERGKAFFAGQTLSCVAEKESNSHARHLYERLGFVQLGTIPKGFRMKDGHFENICPYYHEL